MIDSGMQHMVVWASSKQVGTYYYVGLNEFKLAIIIAMLDKRLANKLVKQVNNGKFRANRSSLQLQHNGPLKAKTQCDRKLNWLRLLFWILKFCIASISHQLSMQKIYLLIL